MTLTGTRPYGLHQLPGFADCLIGPQETATSAGNGPAEDARGLILNSDVFRPRMYYRPLFKWHKEWLTSMDSVIVECSVPHWEASQI